MSTPVPQDGIWILVPQDENPTLLFTPAGNGAAGAGVSDHGTLTGLADDDHTQYHNDTRGDARYSLLAHGHTGTYQPLATVLTNTTASFTTADETKLDAIEALADVTDAGNVGTTIDGATAKTTPVDADTVALIDSAAGNVLKKLSWANIKATAKTYFDTLYATAAQGTDDRTASGLRSATTVVAVSSATAPSSGQVLTATGSAAATWQTPAGGSPAGSSGQFQFNNAAAFGGANLWRESADIAALRNSTTAQTFRVYDTYTDASNYGRLALNTSLTGDWVQVAAETAGTGGDNYGIALTPTGTGAISAHVPDSTAAGGNARGANAVDWQRARTTAVQVASGQETTIGGGSNNVATGIAATVAGGTNNQATGSRGVVAGGDGNTATATYSATLGGLGNTATGQSSVVSGGEGSVASGINSWVPGGIRATTRGLSGAGAYSAGRRTATGDAQVILQPVRQTTSSTSTVNLSTDAAAVSTTNCMVIPVNSGAQFEGRLTAVHAAGAAVGGWKVEGIARRGASGAATVPYVNVTTMTPDAAIGAPTITVVGTASGQLVFAITPANATLTYWVGRLELIQAA